MNKYIAEVAKQFEGKVVIVTEKYSRKWRRTAKLLLQEELKAVTICGRQEDKGNQIKKEIEELGSKCLYVKADLLNVDDCKNIVSLTDKEFGTVNSLVNVAGYTERGTILSATLENYENNLMLIQGHLLFLMQETIKIMIKIKIKALLQMFFNGDV